MDDFEFGLYQIGVVVCIVLLLIVYGIVPDKDEDNE